MLITHKNAAMTKHPNNNPPGGGDQPKTDEDTNVLERTTKARPAPLRRVSN
jgi:hypothetical protein